MTISSLLQGISRISQTTVTTVTTGTGHVSCTVSTIVTEAQAGVAFGAWFSPTKAGFVAL